MKSGLPVGYDRGSSEWTDMTRYLNRADTIKSIREQEEKSRLEVMKSWTELAVAEVMIVAIFFAFPLVMLSAAFGQDFPTSFATALGIYVLDALALSLLIYSQVKKKADRANRTSLGACDEHDDGDNDLDDIRNIVDAIDDIHANIEDIRHWLDDDLAEESCIGEMEEFEETVKDYILVSYWQGHEKKVASGFDITVMRVSAAWTAYLEILRDYEVEGENQKLAREMINKFIGQGQRCAYRNFIRVDSKVHGAEHIFDHPDMPKALSNMEKLSVAAALAEDAE